MPQLIVPNNAISFIVGAVTANVTTAANGLAFQMASLDIDTTRLGPYLLTEYLEPRAYADNIALAGEPLRVMVIRGLDGTSVFMGECLAKNLKYNAASSGVAGGLSAVDSGPLARRRHRLR